MREKNIDDFSNSSEFGFIYKIYFHFWNSDGASNYFLFGFDLLHLTEKTPSLLVLTESELPLKESRLFWVQEDFRNTSSSVIWPSLVLAPELP